MSQQSFKHAFVMKSAALLADGATVETITAGQLGILDAKTHLSETAPTYANQKAIKFVLGTPAISVLTTQGVPNENIYSKLIKGKKIRAFKGKKAVTASTQEIWAIGNTGVVGNAGDLVAKKGEVKHVFLKLTGGQIEKKFSLQGVIRQYSVVEGLVGEAGNASSEALADQLVAAINADPQIKDFVLASKVSDAGKFGVKIEAKLVSRKTDEATYQFFPAYEQESLHIQISEFDPNYNNDVEAAVSTWPVTKLQAFSRSIGSGAIVRKIEEDALRYHLRHRSHDAVVRALEGYAFNADAEKFYDEYILEFDFSYKTGGWSEEYTDSYRLHFYFETGTGAAFETAVNGYLASLGSAIDPVVL